MINNALILILGSMGDEFTRSELGFTRSFSLSVIWGGFVKFCCWLLVVGYFWCAFPCAFRRRGVAPVIGYWAGKPRPYKPTAQNTDYW